MDEGMSLAEAEALAERVRAMTPHTVRVEGEDLYFVVVVVKGSGETLTVRDEQDWDWLRSRTAAASSSHVAEDRRIVSRPTHWQVVPTLCLSVIAVAFAASEGLIASAVLGLVIAFSGLAFLGMQVAYSSSATTSALGKVSPFGAWGMLALSFIWLWLVAR